MVNQKPTAGDRLAACAGSCFNPCCMPFGKPLVNLYRDKYLKRVFRKAGLVDVKVQVDLHTTMLCWVPKKYAKVKLPSPASSQPTTAVLPDSKASSQGGELPRRSPEPGSVELTTAGEGAAAVRQNGRGDFPGETPAGLSAGVASEADLAESGRPREAAMGQAPKPSSTETVPLVLLHAFGPAAVFHWHKQVGPFMKAGIECFVPDLLFFGESTCDRKIYSETFQAECVFQVLRLFGVHKFDVLGVSYGGFVAYRLAQYWPNNVRKVILNDSPGVIVTRVDYDEILVGLGVQDWMDLLIPTQTKYMKEGIAITYYHAPPVPKFILKGAMQAIFEEFPEEKRGLVQHLIAWLNSPESPLPVLLQETLLIWGEHDRAFPLSLAHRLNEFLGDRCKLSVINNTAHQPSLERPKEYNRLVLDFLR